MIQGQHNHRRRILLAGLVGAVILVLARGMQLQVVEAERWRDRAEEQHRQKLALPAPRGIIYDRAGVPIASNREAFRVAVAPGELRDRDTMADRLVDVLGLSPEAAHDAVDPDRRWAVLPGRYGASVHETLEDVPGIYFERVLERFYPHGDLAMELLGRVSVAGRAQGGVELGFDSLLAGRPGVAVVRRNAEGDPIPGAMLTVVAPEPGHDVHLTIDHRLQEIADDALAEAIRETDAEGGDLVLVDPGTGEVLAATSRRSSGSRHWWAATEPYEPGSTLKPFIVSALLAEGRAELGDSIYAEQGRYRHHGRTITDVHGYGWLELREALSYSSNIAMAKAAERLEPGQQYRYLRNFGFGTPTGIAYPSESAGTLRRPAAWSEYSQASLAIGYEIAVTPLQMAMAYAALANDGVLMEPRLVRSVYSRDQRKVREFSPRRLRRVMSPGVARQVNRTLVQAVEQGTGTLAALGGFRVAGKTGTARRVRDGRYGNGGYTASFAGFFPANDPQLVFLVKLDRPKNEYYGGLAAAPVTRRLLEAALAARITPLDRSVIASVMQDGHGAGDRTAERPMPGRRGGSASPVPVAPPAESGPFIFALDAGPLDRFRPRTSNRHRVPDVRGLTLRDAIQRIHARGFQVRIAGSGPVRTTIPSRGTPIRPGGVVRVMARTTEAGATVTVARSAGGDQ